MYGRLNPEQGRMALGRASFEHDNDVRKGVRKIRHAFRDLALNALTMIKAAVMVRNAGEVVANCIGIRNDESLCYELRSGGSLDAWGGKRSLHVVNVIAEVIQQDTYGIKRSRRRIRTAIDIGAHIGTFALQLSKHYPGVRIAAFEPSPENFLFCRANIRRNGIPNVAVIPVGIAGETGRRTFYTDPGNPGGNSLSWREGPLETRPVYHFTEALAILGESEVDLVKLDCEGAETEILTSLTHDLLSRIREIVCEFHPTPGSSATKLAAFLERHGFGVQVDTQSDRNYPILRAVRLETSGAGFQRRQASREHHRRAHVREPAPGAAQVVLKA